MAKFTQYTQKTFQIDLPFTFSNKGSVVSIDDTNPNAWKNRVLTLLSTGINERVWYYNYGAGLTNLVFETIDSIGDDAKATITEMFVAWLPELTLQDVYGSYDSRTATVTFSIIYETPSGATESVKISTASLTAAGELREVTNG